MTASAGQHGHGVLTGSLPLISCGLSLFFRSIVPFCVYLCDCVVTREVVCVLVCPRAPDIRIIHRRV